MTAQISFSKDSWADWMKLDTSTKRKLEKLLRTAAENPHSAGNRLRGELAGLKRLKLTSPQIRVVFRYKESIDTIEIVAIGTRQKIYLIAHERIDFGN